eukprot:3449338-Rhodomonas_salina.1
MHTACARPYADAQRGDLQAEKEDVEKIVASIPKLREDGGEKKAEEKKTEEKKEAVMAAAPALKVKGDDKVKVELRGAVEGYVEEAVFNKALAEKLMKDLGSGEGGGVEEEDAMTSVDEMRASDVLRSVCGCFSVRGWVRCGG